MTPDSLKRVTWNSNTLAHNSLENPKVEIGEAIAVAAVKQTARKPCWFCTAKPKNPPRTNEETADPDTSDGEGEDPESIPENDEHNSSSALGESLIGAGWEEPNWQIKNPLKPTLSTKVVPAAHHCIPGGASLAKATALHKFMREGGPYNFESDIGYNVNAAENGVWLPGNYAVRRGNREFNGKTWSAQSPGFQDRYVEAAMDEADGKMFHDAHPKYNGKVKGTLNSIANKLTKPNKKKCPICGKDLNSGKARPPFALVDRLNFVSDEHRLMLDSPTRKTVNAHYWTSSKGMTVFLKG